jgi:protein gp37
LSVEPLLEPVDLGDLRGIDWVIVGGESGRGCRPMDIEWARSVQAQCQAAGVIFFLKQLGGNPDPRHSTDQFPEDLRIQDFPGVSTAPSQSKCAKSNPRESIFSGRAL